MLVFIIYLLDVLSEIDSAVGAVLVFYACVLPFLVILIAIVDEESNCSYRGKYWGNFWSGFFKYKVVTIFIPLLLSVMVLLIPSKNTMYLMATAYIGEEVLTSDPVQETASKAHEAINKWIDDYLQNDSNKEG